MTDLIEAIGVTGQIVFWPLLILGICLVIYSVLERSIEND